MTTVRASVGSSPRRQGGAAFALAAVVTLSVAAVMVGCGQKGALIAVRQPASAASAAVEPARSPSRPLPPPEPLEPPIPGTAPR